MNMVRHDHIVVYADGGVFFGKVSEVFFCKQASRLRDGRPVPYDITEDPAPVFCADRYEISTVCAVVEFGNAVCFSLGEFHDIPPFRYKYFGMR